MADLESAATLGGIGAAVVAGVLPAAQAADNSNKETRENGKNAPGSE